MKKVYVLYSSIMWASTFSTLVGCSYNAKNGMMDQPSGEGEASGYESYDAKIYQFDPIALSKIKAFKDPLSASHLFFTKYISKNPPRNFKNKLFSIDADFRKIQGPYLKLKERDGLMRTPAVEPGNMNEDQLNQYKNYIVSTPTFHELMYLGYWRENLTKKSKDAFHSERALADYVETEQTQVQEVNAVPLQRNVYTGGKLGKEISNNRKKLCKKRFQEKYASNDPD